MNFVTFTCAPPTCATSLTFTPDQQAQAFEAYIDQDPYLRNHRGQYAERGGLFLPMFNRMDLSIVQDIFRDICGQRNAGQIRVRHHQFRQPAQLELGCRPAIRRTGTAANGAQILTNGAADAQGRASYRLAVVNSQLVTNSFQRSSTSERRLSVHDQFPVFVQLNGQVGLVGRVGLVGLPPRLTRPTGPTRPRHPFINPAISFTNFAATRAVRSRTSFAGCTRQCRHPPVGREARRISSSTSRTERPPGSGCEIPGASIGSSTSTSRET